MYPVGFLTKKTPLIPSISVSVFTNGSGSTNSNGDPIIFSFVSDVPSIGTTDLTFTRTGTAIAGTDYFMPSTASLSNGQTQVDVEAQPLTVSEQKQITITLTGVSNSSMTPSIDPLWFEANAYINP